MELVPAERIIDFMLQRGTQLAKDEKKKATKLPYNREELRRLALEHLSKCNGCDKCKLLREKMRAHEKKRQSH